MKNEQPEIGFNWPKEKAKNEPAPEIKAAMEKYNIFDESRLKLENGIVYYHNHLGVWQDIVEWNKEMEALDGNDDPYYKGNR